MYTKMDNIDIYNNSAIILSRKTPNKILSWITILIILTILFIIFSFIPFNIYKIFFGYVSVEKNNSYIILELNNSDFPVYKDNKLYIKNKKYSYEIVKIEENKIVLNIDLDNNLKINGNILKINILKDRTTLFKIILNKIKKGFGV